MKWAWSYWEQDLIKVKYDLIIVGGGFSGLTSAFFTKKKNPNWKILVLDKAQLQRAASTRNAGFACISSLSELIEDVNKYGWNDTLQLIEWRWKGLEYLRESFTPEEIGYRETNSGELFYQGQYFPSVNYLNQLDEANQHLKSIVGSNYYKLLDGMPTHISNGAYYVSHHQEGQLHPMRLWTSWMKRCRAMDINFIENCEVLSFEDTSSGITVESNWGKFHAKKLLFCTNGEQLESQEGESLEVVPNFVFVSEPIEGLSKPGNLHAEAGFIYARNIENRLLIGGGRHILAPEEQRNPTDEHKDKILKYLHDFTTQYISNVPKDWKPEFGWKGYLGVGKTKTPLMKAINNNTFVLGRLSGMGVALSSYLGREMAKLISQ